MTAQGIIVLHHRESSQYEAWSADAPDRHAIYNFQVLAQPVGTNILKSIWETAMTLEEFTAQPDDYDNPWKDVLEHEFPEFMAFSSQRHTAR